MIPGRVRGRPRSTGRGTRRGPVAQALAGAERLLLVSGSEVGRRMDEHRAVIEVTMEAGVALIA